MLEFLKRHLKNEKGLSLVELLAVIVILGIVAAIAIPAIGNIVEKSSDKAQISEALSIIAGAKLAHIENNCGTETGGCTGAVLEKFVDGKALGNTAVKLNNNEWEISGYSFEMKSGEITTVTTGTGTYSEQTLKTALE